MKKLDAFIVYLILEGASRMIFYVVFTVSMVYQVTMVNLNPLQLVLVGTTLELSVFLFEIPTGVVADIYSRRLSIIIGYILIGFGFILMGVIPLFLIILISQLLWGLGYTFTSGATQAWISDEIGEAAAGMAFLRGSQAGFVGALIGIFISVVLGSFQVNIPIIVGGVFFIFLALFLILVMPEIGFSPVLEDERSSWQKMSHTFRSGITLVRGRPALIDILAIGLFYGLYSEGFDRLWTKHLLDDFTLPPLGELDPIVWFGIINAVGMILSLVAVEVAKRRIDTNRYLTVARLLMWITVVLILSLVGFAQTPKFVVALLMLFSVRVTRSVIDPLYTAWLNQHLDSSVRATVLSMSSQVDAIGQIAGGPFFGFIGNLVSVSAAITASGLVLSPVLALYGRAVRRKQPSVESTMPVK